MCSRSSVRRLGYRASISPLRDPYLLPLGAVDRRARAGLSVWRGLLCLQGETEAIEPVPGASGPPGARRPFDEGGHQPTIAMRDAVVRVRRKSLRAYHDTRTYLGGGSQMAHRFPGYARRLQHRMGAEGSSKGSKAGRSRGEPGLGTSRLRKYGSPGFRSLLGVGGVSFTLESARRPKHHDCNTKIGR